MYFDAKWSLFICKTDQTMTIWKYPFVMRLIFTVWSIIPRLAAWSFAGGVRKYDPQFVTLRLVSLPIELRHCPHFHLLLFSGTLCDGQKVNELNDITFYHIDSIQINHVLNAEKMENFNRTSLSMALRRLHHFHISHYRDNALCAAVTSAPSGNTECKGNLFSALRSYMDLNKRLNLVVPQPAGPLAPHAMLIFPNSTKSGMRPGRQGGRQRSSSSALLRTATSPTPITRNALSPPNRASDCSRSHRSHTPSHKSSQSTQFNRYSHRWHAQGRRRYNKCSPQLYRDRYRKQRQAYFHSTKKRSVTKTGYTTHHISTSSLEYPESVQSFNANKCGSVPPLFRAHSASSVSDLWTTTNIDVASGRPMSSQYSHNPLALAHRARTNNGDMEVANSVRSFADQSQAPSDTPVHSVHNGLNPAWSNPYATGSIMDGHNRNGPGSFHDAASLSSLPMSPTCSFTSLPNMMGSPFISSTVGSHHSSSDHHSDLLNAVELLNDQFDALKKNDNQRLTQFLNAQNQRKSAMAANSENSKPNGTETPTKGQSPNIRAHGDGPIISTIDTQDKSRQSDVSGDDEDEEEVVIITPVADDCKDKEHDDREKENDAPTAEREREKELSQFHKHSLCTLPISSSSIRSTHYNADNEEKKGNEEGGYPKMNGMNGINGTVPLMPLNSMGNLPHISGVLHLNSNAKGPNGMHIVPPLNGLNGMNMNVLNGMNTTYQYPRNLIDVNRCQSICQPMQLKPPFIPLSTVPQYYSTSTSSSPSSSSSSTTPSITPTKQEHHHSVQSVPVTLAQIFKQLPPQMRAELERKGIPQNAVILRRDQVQNYKKMSNGKMQNLNGKVQNGSSQSVNGRNIVNAQWRGNNKGNVMNNHNGNMSARPEVNHHANRQGHHHQQKSHQGNKQQGPQQPVNQRGAASGGKQPSHTNRRKKARSRKKNEKAVSVGNPLHSPKAHNALNANGNGDGKLNGNHNGKMNVNRNGSYFSRRKANGFVAHKNGRSQ